MRLTILAVLLLATPSDASEFPATSAALVGLALVAGAVWWWVR